MKTTPDSQDETERHRAGPAPLPRFIPATDRSTHLVAAAGLWSLVGIGLSISGLWSIGDADAGWWSPVVLVAAAGIGYAKAHFVLFSTGTRIVERIEHRGDGRNIFGFLSWQNWLMVGGFILLGRALRATPMPEWLLGGIFLAVGVGLLFASLPIWKHWRRRYLQTTLRIPGDR